MGTRFFTILALRLCASPAIAPIPVEFALFAVDGCRGLVEKNFNRWAGSKTFLLRVDEGASQGGDVCTPRLHKTALLQRSVISKVWHTHIFFLVTFYSLSCINSTILEMSAWKVSQPIELPFKQPLQPGTANSTWL